MFCHQWTSQTNVAQCAGGIQRRANRHIVSQGFGTGILCTTNIKTPVKVAIVILLVTQALNLSFFLFVESLQHAGLALSISLGACLNSGILYYLLHKYQIYQPQSGWFRFFIRLFAALILLGLTLWFGMGTGQSWLARTGWARVIHLSWLIAAGIAIYFAALWALGFRLRDFSRRGVS